MCGASIDERASLRETWPLRYCTTRTPHRVVELAAHAKPFPEDVHAPLHLCFATCRRLADVSLRRRLGRRRLGRRRPCRAGEDPRADRRWPEQPRLAEDHAAAE